MTLNCSTERDQQKTFYSVSSFLGCSLAMKLPGHRLIHTVAIRYRIASQNTEFTTEAEITPSVQQELTKFNEVADEVHASIPKSISSVHGTIANPFPDQVPAHILSRNFRIADGLINAGWAGMELDFPDLLLQRPAIMDALSTFKWIRADVSVEVRVNSTPYHLGALMITYLPCSAQAGLNIYEASGNRPVVMSIGSQQGATIKIPYVNPLTWLDWRYTSTTSIARLYIYPLFPLINTSSTVSDDVPIQVFANFENVQVAGFEHDNNFTAEMSVVRSLQEIVDEPPEEEAKDKGFFETIGGLSRTGVPILKHIGHFVSGITSIFKAFSIFDKPNIVTAPVRVFPQHSTDLPHGYGLSRSISLGLSPNSYLSAPGKIDPGETSSTLVSAIASVPMLHYVSLFDNEPGNLSKNLVVKPRYLNNTYRQPDYLMFLSDHFNYWRGSIKYRLSFYATPFTSCRFRISYNVSPWSSAVATSGDLVSKIVDVKGDTHVDLTIPYLSEVHWRKIRDASDYPRLVIEKLVPIVGQALEGDSVVYLVVWRGAGEDLRFAQLTQDRPPIFEQIVAQADMREVFTNKFAHIIDGCQQSVEQGFVMPEVIADLGACLKRFSSTTMDKYQPHNPPATATRTDPFWSIARIFLFWRGSVNVKTGAVNQGEVFMRSDLTPGVVGPTFGTGIALQSTGNYPFNEFSVPWFCSLPYYPNNPSLTVVDGSNNLSPETATSVAINGQIFLIAAGDDFQYLWLRNPPSYPLTLRVSATP